jgi:hypothetical protein
LVFPKKHANNSWVSSIPYSKITATKALYDYF